jgi:hypothetical protein
MEAEGVRFELTRPFGLPVFKTGAINRSATPPEALRPTVAALNQRRKPWEKLAKVIRRRPRLRRDKSTAHYTETQAGQIDMFM